LLLFEFEATGVKGMTATATWTHAGAMGFLGICIHGSTYDRGVGKDEAGAFSNTQGRSRVDGADWLSRHGARMTKNNFSNKAKRAKPTCCRAAQWITPTFQLLEPESYKRYFCTTFPGSDQPRPAGFGIKDSAQGMIQLWTQLKKDTLLSRLAFPSCIPNFRIGLKPASTYQIQDVSLQSEIGKRQQLIQVILPTCAPAIDRQSRQITHDKTQRYLA
jgi:hypothetical protein